MGVHRARRRPRHRWTPILMALLLALVSMTAPPSSAQLTSEFYQATVIVTGTDMRSRPLGFGQALRAVFVNVSGEPRLHDDPRVSDTLGWILYKRGVYQRALSLLKESASKLPDQPVIQHHLGMASLKAGDKEGARVALTAAVNSPTSFPGKDEARKALSDLQ